MPFAQPGFAQSGFSQGGAATCFDPLAFDPVYFDTCAPPPGSSGGKLWRRWVLPIIEEVEDELAKILAFLAGDD